MLKVLKLVPSSYRRFVKSWESLCQTLLGRKQLRSQAMEDDLNHLGFTLLFMEEACVWNDVVLQVGKRMDPLLFQLAKLAGWSCMKSYDLSHR
ncbi:hypothetical protein SDJN03_13540, partial [Cucurbita argyrosperma subsp. sororia]